MAVVSIDPSRRKSGGALLGDRIPCIGNAISPWQGFRVFHAQSRHARHRQRDFSPALPDVIAACKAAGFDLIVVETSGIGQATPPSSRTSTCPLYVMTPEFGAASQLEKIDMLGLSPSSWRSTSSTAKAPSTRCAMWPKQVQRNKGSLTTPPERCRCSAPWPRGFNDDGVTACTRRWVRLQLGRPRRSACPSSCVTAPTRRHRAPARTRYLAEISDTVRATSARARATGNVKSSSAALGGRHAGDDARTPHDPDGATVLSPGRPADQAWTVDAAKLLAQWPGDATGLRATSTS